MINAPVSDVNLGSVHVKMSGSEASLFLHTSPEYAMKRLLAAGSGDIFQICRVYRGAERGRQHNPEFTMLEWYRLGFSLEQLMSEVAELTNLLLASQLPVEFVSFREAVRQHAGFDPLDADIAELQGAARSLGFDASQAARAGRDELLDLIVRGFPSPKDHPVPPVTSPDGKAQAPLTADPSAPLCAEVVKTTTDPYVGRVSLVPPGQLRQLACVVPPHHDAGGGAGQHRRGSGRVAADLRWG